jgi:hypothetical protein
MQFGMNAVQCMQRNVCAAVEGMPAPAHLYIRDFFSQRPLALGWPRGMGSWLDLATSLATRHCPCDSVGHGQWLGQLLCNGVQVAPGTVTPPPPATLYLATVLSVNPIQRLVVLRNTGLL